MIIGKGAHRLQRARTDEEVRLAVNALRPVHLESVLALAVHHNAVVRDGLARPALVLGQVAAAEFRLDVEPARKAVLAQDLLAPIEERDAQGVEVAMAHAVLTVVHAHLADVAIAPLGAQKTLGAAVTVRAFTEFDAGPQWRCVAAQRVGRSGQAQRRRLHPYLALLACQRMNRRIVAVAGVIDRCGNQHALVTDAHAARGIVERRQAAVWVGGGQQGLDRAADRLVVVVVDIQLGAMELQRLGEDQQRPDREAMVVRAFHVIA